jgi:altronate dehydratase small subunit
MDAAYKTVMMKPQDHVAVALTDIPAHVQLSVTCQDQTFTIVLKDPINFGHKFAVRPIELGEDIYKYGEVIGVAVKEIAIGEHVHVHNLAGKRGRGDLGVQATER